MSKFQNSRATPQSVGAAGFSQREKHLLGFDIGGTKCAAILGKVSIDNQFQILEKRI